MTVANAVEAAAAQAGFRDPASYALFEAHQARVPPYNTPCPASQSIWTLLAHGWIPQQQ